MKILSLFALMAALTSMPMTGQASAFKSTLIVPVETVLYDEVQPYGEQTSHGSYVYGGPGHFTLTGTSGPYRPYTSRTRLAISLSAKQLDNFPATPLPPTTTVVSNDPYAPVRTVFNLAPYSFFDPLHYKETVSALSGVPVNLIPDVPARVPFDGVELGRVSLMTTSFDYSRQPFIPSSGTFSFEATFNENDDPGFHHATFAVGNRLFDLQPGSHAYSFSAGLQGSISFDIWNSDNRGGPSSLEVRKLSFSALYPDAATIVKSVDNYAVQFVALPVPVPEPAPIALLAAGTALLAAKRRRARGPLDGAANAATRHQDASIR